MAPPFKCSKLPATCHHHRHFVIALYGEKLAVKDKKSVCINTVYQKGFGSFISVRGLLYLRIHSPKFKT